MTFLKKLFGGGTFGGIPDPVWVLTISQDEANWQRCNMREHSDFLDRTIRGSGGPQGVLYILRRDKDKAPVLYLLSSKDIATSFANVIARSLTHFHLVTPIVMSPDKLLPMIVDIPSIYVDLDPTTKHHREYTQQDLIRLNETLRKH